MLLLVLLILTIGNILSWHGYNKTDSNDLKSKHCHNINKDARKPLSNHEYERMKLWPGLRSKDDDSETLYGLKHGLEEIWRHQFPSDCSNKKFLISGGWPYGFGSRIHMEGMGLAVAMQLGRIYLPHPFADNIFWVSIF